MRHSSQTELSLTRRQLLQGTVGSTARVLAWYQGWPQLRTALAQKGAPSGQMTWAIHVRLPPSGLIPLKRPASLPRSCSYMRCTMPW
jgi:hypothetical protein